VQYWRQFPSLTPSGRIATEKMHEMQMSPKTIDVPAERRGDVMAVVAPRLRG
jgi:hypothetical protein